MTRIGVDAIVAEGMEAGGHIGQLTTMTLVRRSDAVDLPVIAAGVSLMERYAAGLCWVLRQFKLAHALS